MAWYDKYDTSKKKKKKQPVQGLVDFSGATYQPSYKRQPVQQPSLGRRFIGGAQQFGEGARVPIQSLLDLLGKLPPSRYVTRKPTTPSFTERFRNIPHAAAPQTTAGKVTRVAGRIAGELPAFVAADIGAAGVLGRVAPKVAKTGLGALERAGLSFGAIGQLEPGTIEERLKRIPRDVATGVITAGVGKLAGKALQKFKLTKEVTPAISKIEKPVISDPVQKVIQALKESKPMREGQEALYSAQRGKRLGRALAIGQKAKGEQGFYAQLGALKGQLIKADFESIRKQIGQNDIDTLFKQIEDHSAIIGFEKITTKEGLAKLLGQQGGQIPTRGEIGLLNKVFGEDFTNAVLAKRSLLSKFSEIGTQAWNLPKSIVASTDLSAPLRQGAFLMGKPKQFLSAFVNMFRYAGSEKAFKELEQSIVKGANYELKRKGGLALTDIGSQLGQREEAMLSNWGEKIPFFRHIARGSNRAYTGFLNKLRSDVFDDLVKKAEKQGLDPKKNDLFIKNLAGFINNATGRGGLGSLEKDVMLLSNALFSPRLIASRLTLLNPTYYAKLDPFTRKEALKSLFTFAGTALSVAQLAKMGGAKVGTDPRNSDFMKIKIGNTRIDTLAGFQQYIRAAAQIYTGKYISSTTGKEFTLGEGYKPLTRLGVAGKIAASKLSPTASFIKTLLEGQDFAGKKVKPSQEIIARFIPLVLQDFYDLYQEGGIEDLPKGIPAIFGTGVQTYGAKPVKKELPEALNEYLAKYLQR